MPIIRKPIKAKTPPFLNDMAAEMEGLLVKTTLLYSVKSILHY